MTLNCPNCDCEMSEDDAGIDKTDVQFTLTFTCGDCNTTAEVSFNADEDVEVTNEDGSDTWVNIHDILD